MNSVRPNPNGSAERSAKMDRTCSAERSVKLVRSSVRPFSRKKAIFDENESFFDWFFFLSYKDMQMILEKYYSHSQWLFYEFVSKITNKLVKQSLRVTVLWTVEYESACRKSLFQHILQLIYYRARSNHLSSYLQSYQRKWSTSA